jgi:hypothetical protein
MNRISSYLPQTNETKGHPMLKAERRLQRDVEVALREVAFVLAMTLRVKREMLEENAARSLRG